ncbi:MAG: DsbA family protein [Kofleriaceae bacterium]
MLRVALVVAIVAWAPGAHAQKRGFDPAGVYQVPRGASPASGPVDAPITIVSWSDHACGYCYRVQSTLAAIDELYPRMIRWVHRTLPLDEDQTITAEATLAAAAQGAFVPMSDRIYAVAGRVDRTGVELIARELGLDMVRFRADLDTRVYRAQITADEEDAKKLGLSGTPAFFINGRPIHGNQPLKIFVDTIDEELARAKTTSGGYDALVGTGRPTADHPGGTEHPEVTLDPNTTYRMGLGLPGHQLGPDKALVSIVVWSDFQCPFCASSVPVLQQLRAKFGDEIRIVFRHLAMTAHRQAQLASEAAIAAAEQGKFWAFHDRLFAQFGSLDRADLERFAKDAGVDLVKFRAALDDRRYHALVVAEGATAMATGVDGTPTMFVNGHPVVGSRKYSTMETLVQAHLERGRAAVAAGLGAGDIYALVMSSAIGAERADPSRVPDVAGITIAPRPEDRVRSVAAACRMRDAKRAVELARGLTGAVHARVSAVCAIAGIDLP